MHIVQVGNLLKSVKIGDVDRKQTLLILPAPFLKKFSAAQCASFQELGRGVLRLDIIETGEKPVNKAYRFVTSAGATWVSVPRKWLRNMGGAPGDLLDVFEAVDDPRKLIVKYRRADSGQI